MWIRGEVTVDEFADRASLSHQGKRIAVAVYGRPWHFFQVAQKFFKAETRDWMWEQIVQNRDVAAGPHEATEAFKVRRHVGGGAYSKAVARNRQKDALAMAMTLTPIFNFELLLGSRQ